MDDCQSADSLSSRENLQTLQKKHADYQPRWVGGSVATKRNTMIRS